MINTAMPGSKIPDFTVLAALRIFFQALGTFLRIFSVSHPGGNQGAGPCPEPIYDMIFSVSHPGGNQGAGPCPEPIYDMISVWILWKRFPERRLK
jgi:hypothetical protein